MTFRCSVGGYHVCLSRTQPGFESRHRNTFCLTLYLPPSAVKSIRPSLLSSRSAYFSDRNTTTDPKLSCVNNLIPCTGTGQICCFLTEKPAETIPNTKCIKLSIKDHYSDNLDHHQMKVLQRQEIN